ncbi:MAG: ABC transporter permease [Phaeodactylibacter sp.]|nr:ABC transporter permease [Phaeodactylibacter sp.]
MLFKIAWRNIWRSRTRSLVVIGAITVGVWSIIFLLSFSNGMVTSYVNNALENEISHIQVHNPKFIQDREVQYTIPQSAELLQALEATEGVKAGTMRTLVNGMLSTSQGARGVVIRGILPDQEAAVTKLNEKIVEGEYFGDHKNQILISTSLAEKLKVKIRSKVVLNFQTPHGELSSGAFRIVGLYETNNNTVDEGNVFVVKTDLNRLLHADDIAHEAAFLLSDLSLLDTTATVLQEKIKQLGRTELVQTYKEISPDIELMNSQMQVSTAIFTVIFMLALIFGIINTMLMAVLERIRELGMLMSIGMNKVRVFLMIMLETILLGVIAAPIGLLLGHLTVSRLAQTGINLSLWSEGMQEFGIADMIYPSVVSGLYVQLAVSVFITALLAAIYPAFKAIQLKPVEAIRTV